MNGFMKTPNGNNEKPPQHRDKMQNSNTTHFEVYGCFSEPFERWHRLNYRDDVGEEMTLEQAQELCNELISFDGVQWDILRIYKVHQEVSLVQHVGVPEKDRV